MHFCKLTGEAIENVIRPTEWEIIGSICWIGWDVI